MIALLIRQTLVPPTFRRLRYMYKMIPNFLVLDCCAVLADLQGYRVNNSLTKTQLHYLSGHR